MNRLAAPFEIRRAPLRQFCELAYDGHDHYRTIELQYLDIAPDRKGYMVLMGRHDGKLNVFSEPALSIDEAWCRSDPAVTHYSHGRVEIVDLEDVALKTGVDGVDARVAFDDPDGRRVEMTIVSAKSGPAKTHKLFVPASPRPSVRMLWFLYAFAYGPLRPADKIDMKIDGQALVPRRWPWPLGLRPHVQGRYGDDIVIFSLNPPTDAPLAHIEDDDAFVLDERAGGISRIRAWRQHVNGHSVEARFDPPISAIALDGQAAPGEGRLAITIDNIVTAKGRYRLSAIDGKTSLIFSDINQQWTPPDRDISVWMLEFYRRMKFLRRRWHWQATIRPNRGRLFSDSAWVVR